MPDEDSTGKGPDEDVDAEVLSFAMTDREDTDETTDNEPHLTPSEPDAGFDGWLDDGKKDPYGELSDGSEAPDEVSDWLAFAAGEDDEESPEESLDEEALSPPAAELPPTAGDGSH